MLFTARRSDVLTATCPAQRKSNGLKTAIERALRLRPWPSQVATPLPASSQRFRRACKQAGLRRVAKLQTATKHGLQRALGYDDRTACFFDFCACPAQCSFCSCPMGQQCISNDGTLLHMLKPSPATWCDSEIISASRSVCNWTLTFSLRTEHFLKRSSCKGSTVRESTLCGASRLDLGSRCGSRPGEKARTEFSKKLSILCLRIL